MVFWKRETSEFRYFCCWPRPDGRITSPPTHSYTHPQQRCSLTHTYTQQTRSCTIIGPISGPINVQPTGPQHVSVKRHNLATDMNQRSYTLCHCPSLQSQRSVQLINMTIYIQNYTSNRAIYEFNYNLLLLSVV